MTADRVIRVCLVAVGAALAPGALWAEDAAPSETAVATAPANLAQPAEKQGGDLELVFFDVRQGDSTLIRTPAGRYVLIDGGVCRLNWNKYDAAEKVIIPYLKENGVTRLDVVIATHPDFDHIGGLLTLLKNRDIDVGCYLDPGVEHPTDVYADLLKLVKERGIPYKVGRAGQKLKLGKGIDAEVLNPAELFSTANDCSIVFRIQYGNVSFLLTGDAEGEAESSMEERYGKGLKATVLKAGHHGSRNSTGDSFLELVRPAMAVISCGKRNKFGHPHKDTLERLKAAGAKIYRTDQLGTIVMRTDGKSIRVSTRETRKKAAVPHEGTDEAAR
jgi:beta-lactamase superfamily II metal-dependent hydrolase